MSNEIEEVSDLITSDKLHNKNCFNYLRNLKLPTRLLQTLPPNLSELAEIQNQPPEKYNPDFAYGDLYKRFFDYIDDKTVIHDLYNKTLPELKEKIESELKLAKAQLEQQERIKDDLPEGLRSPMRLFRKNLEAKIKALEMEQSTIEEQFDDLFISMYVNNNKILEETYEIIKDITLQHTPVAPEIKSSIAKRTKDKKELINKESQTPSQAESTFARVSSVFSDTYKPQHTTSLATERHYKWNEGSPVKEVRFGTQGQRHEGIEQVSPAFEKFLSIQAKRAQSKEMLAEPIITHIYFNNLGRDRNDFEGKKEKALTHELEKLEKRHLNIAVITLPADKGLMDHHDYQNTAPTHQFDDVREEFLKIASQDSTCALPIKDFYISERTRKLLFKDEEGEYSIDTERKKLGELIDKSFAALNIKPGTVLSPAQKQAVWFHFIKSELTNHIIDTLKPKDLDAQLTINFSCKDAIDRGGVSSAYYNLVNSFERSHSPMSREEFERALHAAPTMVKGRGMNDHIKILWNCVDLYVNKNYETLKQDPERAWLIEWRDLNCPKARVQEVLKNRLLQLMTELEEARQKEESKQDNKNTSKLEAIQKGIEILEKIQNQVDQGVSGKRLLLEAAVRTPTMVLNPTEENVKQYEKLSDKLSIKYPALNVIGGLMKSLVGLVVYAISKGKKQDMLNEGWATVKSGLEVGTRRDLQSKMKEQLRELKAEKVIEHNKEDTLTHDYKVLTS